MWTIEMMMSLTCQRVTRENDNRFSQTRRSWLQRKKIDVCATCVLVANFATNVCFDLHVRSFAIDKKIITSWRDKFCDERVKTKTNNRAWSRRSAKNYKKKWFVWFYSKNLNSLTNIKAIFSLDESIKHFIFHHRRNDAQKKIYSKTKLLKFFCSSKSSTRFSQLCRTFFWKTEFSTFVWWNVR